MDLDDAIRNSQEGSPKAIYDLVFNYFKLSLSGVVNNVVQKQTDAHVYVWLSDFYYFLTTPTKHEHRNRLGNLSSEGNPESYLCNMMHNWLLDELRKRQRKLNKTTSLEASPDRRDDTDDEAMERKREMEKRIRALILALESLPEMKPRDRYILLTYLMAERYKGKGGPLRISRYLAQHLGMTEAAVKMSHKRSLDLLRKRASSFL